MHCCHPAAATDCQCSDINNRGCKVASKNVALGTIVVFTIVLANRPPPAAFCSLFGGGGYKNCRMNQNDTWDRHTHMGQTHTHMGQTHTHMGQTHIDQINAKTFLFEYQSRPKYFSQLP